MKKSVSSFWLPFLAVIIVLIYGFIMRLHYEKKNPSQAMENTNSVENEVLSD